MNQEKFIEYVNNPNKLNDKSLLELGELVDNYPYFQAARLLYLKNLNLEKNIKFNSQLKITAAHISDKKIIYRLIHSQLKVAKENKATVNTPDAPELVPAIPKEEVKLSIESEIKNKKNNLQPEEKSTKYSENNIFELVVDENVNKDSKPELAKELELKDKEPIVNIEVKKEPTNKIETEKKKEEEIPFSEMSIADQILYKINKDKSPKNKNEESIADIILKKIKESKKEQSTSKSKASVVDKKAYSTKITQTKVKSKQHISTDQKQPEKNSQEINKEKVSYTKDRNILDDQNNTFADWVDIISKKDEDKKSNSNLIDDFVNTKPLLKRQKPANKTQKDLSKNSVDDNNSLITESLINIYIKQKLFEKAIQSYEKLSLKFPEKNVYFANRMKEIKKLINNKK